MKYKQLIKATIVVYFTWTTCKGLDMVLVEKLQPVLKKLKDKNAARDAIAK